MARIKVPDGELDYDVLDLSPPWAPASQTILFHHGLGSCRGIWAGLAAGAGRRVSDRDVRHAWPRRLRLAGTRRAPGSGAVDGRCVRPAGRGGAERAHLVGESIGGTIMLNAALRAPDRALSLTVSNGAHVGATIQSVEVWERLLAEGGGAAGPPI